ncbi:hypothetical protein D9613_009059 [Agrocybe pediades]|uniref:Uncharacterized protein n=1 Tax=Agrocybe pediades TaxID=84607 RepID=A0A8H4VWA9_9AGAR|nr:hypothetical protein D9613_009059 [Agrocybe pediades]
MPDVVEMSDSSDSFPADWSMPSKPGLAKECGLHTFGFRFHPTQRKKLGIDTIGGYEDCKREVYERLADELPPAWRHMTYGAFRRPEGGPLIRTRVVYHDTNKNEEERDRLPDMESVEQVYEIICAKEGPRWFLYDRV